MADADSGEVVPDEALLKAIFPGQQTPQASVIINNWTKCVFKAEFPGSGGDDNRRSHPPQRVIVRLEEAGEEAGEGSESGLAAVAAMQRIAAIAIPDLVPGVLGLGLAANVKGRKFQFCVLEFVEGVTLEEAWDDQMTEGDRAAVVMALVEAVRKLQSLQISDTSVREILGPALGTDGGLSRAVRFGGAWSGYLADGRALLAWFESRWNLGGRAGPFFTVEPRADLKSLVVTSKFRANPPPSPGIFGFEDVTVEDSDMEEWAKDAVFCHNDLTPRNIMVRPVPQAATERGARKFELAAMIDWELAGFYPAAFQLALQDSYLGTASQRVGFYLSLKEGLRGLLLHATPGRETVGGGTGVRSQRALAGAMALMFEGRSEHLSLVNDPARMRKLFTSKLGLVRDADPLVGWRLRDRERGVPAFSRADGEKLEADAEAEVKINRQAAKARKRAMEQAQAVET